MGTVGKREEAYRQAYEAWEPTPGDSPEGHWFYRAWAGLIAVVGEETVKRYNGAIHNAIGWAGIGSHGVTLQGIAEALQVPPLPPKPERAYYTYHPEPDYDPKRPYAIFRKQFRAKFPGKRLNSRFAKDQWKSVQSKAEEIAREEHQGRVERWRKNETAHQIDLARRIAEWEERCQAIQEFAAFKAQLVGGKE